MAIFKVLFQPLEEYFFGSEGSFREGVKNAEYFISSREFPSQTTIFGILRYLNLRHKKDSRNYSEEENRENIEAIGGKGFCLNTAITQKKKQSFGTIKAMSSVFLHEYDKEKKETRVYISLPKDAKKNVNQLEPSYESAFEDGEEVICTLDGEKLMPKGYHAKEGLERGFISIDGGINEREEMISGKLKVISSPFEYILKTGLRIKKKTKSARGDIQEEGTEPMSSLFKKEYVRLKQDTKEIEYSFGVYVEIENCEEEVIKKLNIIVGMGLGGSLFKVRAEKIGKGESERLQEGLKLSVERVFEEHLKKNEILYCISPCYLDEPQKIIKNTKFASVEVTENRPLHSKEVSKIWGKGDTLYRMLEKGSILITDSGETVVKDFENEALQQIGYNHYYYGGKR